MLIRWDDQADEDPVELDAALAEGIDQHRHADIGVEAVTSLIEGTGLEIGNRPQTDIEQAQAADKKHSQGRSRQIVPVPFKLQGCCADLPEQHQGEKNKIDQLIGGTVKGAVCDLPMTDKPAKNDQRQNREKSIEKYHGIAGARRPKGQ